MKKNDKKALILLSGGLDSTTTLLYAKKKGFDLYTISFNYGQRHLIELKASKKISKIYGVKKYKVCKIDLTQFGGSALTDNINVPKNRKESEIMKNKIPVTYVPARNTIFLSMALAYAEVMKIDNIFLGVNAIDYSGYPDCRPEYIKSFQKLANLATKQGVNGNKIKIHTPLINLTKSEIIKLGLKLGVDYKLTFTCYSPLKNGNSCGACDSCKLRLKGFKELKIKDPLEYESQA